MTGRERVLRAIKFACPDAVPVAHSVLPAARQRYGAELEALFEKYPSDFGGSGFVPVNSSTFSEEPPGRYVDIWGCVWEKLQGGIVGQVKEHPLSDVDRLRCYRWPDPLTSGTWDAVPATIAANRDKYVLGSGGNLWERMQWLRGYEDLLCDLATDAPHAYEIRDRVLEHNLGLVREWVKYDVDGIGFSDDWGTQTALIVSPPVWRRFFKPAYRRLFDVVHAAGRYVHFHTDGQTMEIIPDLVEIGVDVINPQFPLVEAAWLRRVFGDRLCVIGGTDRQYYLPFATPAALKAHCRDLVRTLGGNSGGFIGTGEIGPDVPLPNAEAMYEAFAEYGRYGPDGRLRPGPGE